MGRFISSDSYTSTGTGVLGYNMFAYCNNNPVMLIDGNGDFPKLMDFISSTCEDAKELCAIIGIATGVASILFDSENKVLTTVTKICDDVINFDANNEDAEKVLNSKYFSAYKGKLVIRHSFDGTSCGIFETIFLNRVDADDDTVKHEYGHTLQEEQIGTVGYIFKVAIPSLTCYCLSDKYDWFDRNYFNMPWEYNADERGEVSSRTYAWWAKVVSDIYW